jgi:hypothetical protein
MAGYRRRAKSIGANVVPRIIRREFELRVPYE